MMEGEAELRSVQEELKRIQAELGAVHQAQQMLIEDNQTQHLELADFKERFESKLPQVAATAVAQQKHVDTVTLNVGETVSREFRMHSEDIGRSISDQMAQEPFLMLKVLTTARVLYADGTIYTYTDMCVRVYIC